MNKMTLALATLLAVAAGVRGFAADRSPGDTVKAFYAAANHGLYAEAEGYLAAQAVEAIKAGGRTPSPLQDFCDSRTRRARVARVEVLKSTVKGADAEVVVRVQYKDGEAIVHETLEREGRIWRITLGAR